MGQVAAFTPATKLRRFVHWLIDRATVLGLIFLALVVAGVIGGDAVLDWVERLAWWQEQLIAFVVVIVYYTLMEGVTGTTVGKRVTGTRCCGVSAAWCRSKPSRSCSPTPTIREAGTITGRARA